MEWLTKEQISKRVMVNAHKRFSSPRNTKTWKECLDDSWDVVRLLKRSGYIRELKLFVHNERLFESGLEPVNYGDVDPVQLGYGVGRYCGD